MNNNVDKYARKINGERERERSVAPSVKLTFDDMHAACSQIRMHQHAFSGARSYGL